MGGLFPEQVEAADIPAIPGLSYLSNYLNDAEEAELAWLIDTQEWDTSWERRRQLYGATYGPGRGSERPIPSWGRSLGDRIHGEGLCDRPFDQMLVNEYKPGQGIALHRDHQPFDRTVVSLSLLAPWVMDFYRPQDGQRFSLLLERRSLLVLSDEARYEWEHGIARRKSDRWKGMVVPRRRRLSVTFRRRKTSEKQW